MTTEGPGTVVGRMMLLSPRFRASTNAPAARISCWTGSGQPGKLDAVTGS